jgi:hypothetical protein
MKCYLYNAAPIAAILLATMSVSALADSTRTTICISDNPENNRCPANVNWVNCHPGDWPSKAKDICSLAMPDGSKKPLPYLMSDGPQGSGGPCGWHEINITCVLP